MLLPHQGLLSNLLLIKSSQDNWFFPPLNIPQLGWCDTILIFNQVKCECFPYNRCQAAKCFFAHGIV